MAARLHGVTFQHSKFYGCGIFSTLKFCVLFISVFLAVSGKFKCYCGTRFR